MQFFLALSFLFLFAPLIAANAEPINSREPAATKSERMGQEPESSASKSLFGDWSGLKADAETHGISVKTLSRLPLGFESADFGFS